MANSNREENHSAGVFDSPPWNSGENPFKRERPLPLDRAVFWFPVNQASEPHRARAYLRFITLGALKEIAHHTSAQRGVGRLGFLLGDLYICPETNARYIVVDSTVPAPHPVRGDRTLQTVTLAWPRLQEKLRMKRCHLLGWYHMHPDGGLTLTPSDVTTHLRYFSQPWQFAMVLEPGVKVPNALICRPGNKSAPKTAMLPFYELLEPESLLAEGVRQTYFRWHNYRTDSGEAIQEAAATVTPIPTPMAPPDIETEEEEVDHHHPARVILPNDLDVAFAGELNGLFRRPAQRKPRRRSWLAAAGLVVVLASALALWKFVPWGSRAELPIQLSRPATQPASQPETQVDPVLARLDELADDVASAVRGYEERARLYDNRQMTCADLARGLAQLDERWTAYNVEGRSRVGDLDPARTQKDEALYSEVQDAERHFRATGCPAP